jgi:hypothetical protein
MSDSESRRAHLRQLLHGCDQMPAIANDRARIGEAKFTDKRDTAWTARDLVSLSRPGPRDPFWWELQWPRTTYQPPSTGVLF